ncbi:MAG: tetratricopeptide repeat-containing protein [Leptolyngbya sp. SIOISBB]|nr:tetratricopeptide repeat-containing protein [Leptolyngbya sp. SIOISBB]
MAKGFGKLSAIPTRDGAKFLLAFGKCYAEAKGDNEEVQQFLESRLKQINESLLDALPQIFDKLVTDGKAGDRENIAALFNAFGSRVDRLQSGSRALNLELSLVAHQTASKALKRSRFPEQWAMTQNNLGNAYGDRIRGDRAENLEQAIAAYELALKVRTCDTFPEEWATTQDNLGSAYGNRIRGDRAENLEQAIAAYELALKVRTRDALPEEWAGTQNNLGIAYGDRIRGDRTENLEQAIAAYELALQTYTRDAFPEDWAMTQNNIGLGYLNRIKGDRTVNFEKAINAFELALEVYTCHTFPEDWARGKHNLANAYRDLIRGEPTSNLQTAIKIYQQVAQLFTRKAFPYKWAENQGHLAEAFMKQAELRKHPEDLDTAILLLQEALEVSVSGSPDFIDSKYRLGTALSRRFEKTQNPEDLKQALDAYKTALEAISPEHYERAKIWQALPTTQSVLGSRLVREGEWQEGLQLLLNSVRLLREGDDPLAHANALYQTGRAHETLSDWDNARLYYRDALRLYDHLKDEPGMAKSRHGLGSILVSQGYVKKGMAELEKSLDLYRHLGRSDKVTEVESLQQAVQQVEQNISEAMA